MKKIVLIIAIAFSFTSCYTYKNVVFEKDEFNRVYDDVKGTQLELFVKANNWMVSTFNSAESVIQFSDKEAGVITGKYLMRGNVSYTAYGNVDTRIFAIIEIRVKDNKALIAITPERYRYADNLKNAWTKEKAIEDMDKLAESFHSSLKTAGVGF